MDIEISSDIWSIHNSKVQTYFENQIRILPYFHNQIRIQQNNRICNPVIYNDNQNPQSSNQIQNTPNNAFILLVKMISKYKLRSY